MANAIQEPEILTAKTYFWSPAQGASSRRKNEEKRIDQVKSFFEQLGMETEVSPDSVSGKIGEIEASFFYSESCKNVYKSLTIRRGGKNSNIKSLRKLYK